MRDSAAKSGGLKVVGFLAYAGGAGIQQDLQMTMGRRDKTMIEVRNLSHKRVGDVSKDARMFVIIIEGCITKIRANPDGTLSITQERLKASI